MIFSPSSAVVLAGGTVIIGGDDFSDRKVVGFAFSGTNTENVTGAKKITNNYGITTIIIRTFS